MKKMNVLIATILSATILFGAVLPTNAAAAEVNIEVKATEMDQVSVTVPTSVPIIFNADGTNTLPTNWTIENKSQIAGIHLAKVEMDAKSSGWNLMSDELFDMREQEKDQKNIQFYVGLQEELKSVLPDNAEKDTKGSVTFDSTEISIPSGEIQVLSFDVNRGAFTQDIPVAKAFDMTLTFEFN